MLKPPAPKSKPPLGPVELARRALMRRVRDPIRRMNALALELRDRDLTDAELAIMCEDVEKTRQAIAVLRRSANEPAL